jgi:hypothetical protein
MIVQRIFFFSDVFENSPSSEVHERGARNTDQNLADQDESNLEKSEQLLEPQKLLENIYFLASYQLTKRYFC